MVRPPMEPVTEREQIWQVRLPDGSIYVAEDSRPGDPRAGWIYARSTADAVAKELGGEVVEVTRRQHEKVLDREIGEVLAEPPRGKPKAPKPTKTRTRPFSRAARRAIATAILESVPLNYHARSAIDTARDTADAVAYKAALRTLQTGLPATLWIGHDPKQNQGFAQTAEPVWIADDPQGEDPGQWRQIEREEIARTLVEDA